jgi:hypothetical protein
MEAPMPKINSIDFNLSLFKFVLMRKKDADFNPNIDPKWRK